MKAFADYSRQAFSLIELLTVVAILSLLLVMIIPTLSSLSDSNSLTIGGQVLADQINAARQTASARNKAVELRLIKQGGNPGYSAVQLWMAGEGTNYTAVTRVLPLAKNVVVAENTSLSEILKTARPDSMNIGGTNSPYMAIQVQPSGLVVPVIPMSASYLTLVPQRDATTNAQPANYVTLQVNPITGSPLIYRP